MVWLIVAALLQTLVTDARDAALVAPATIVPVDPVRICGVVHAPGVVIIPSPAAQSA